MAIKDYSTSPGSNTSISGINIAEGCPPSTINNAIRQEMADTRAQWNDAEWFQYGAGDGAATITYASATSFTIAGVDVTDEYHAGRRVKAVGSSTGTIYGTIQSSSFSTNTTVTVDWDSGQLENEALEIYLAILRAENPSLPTGDAVRDHLGLGSMATQNADSVAITGGQVSGVTISGNTLTPPQKIESTSPTAHELLVVEKNNATNYADNDKFLLTLRNNQASNDTTLLRWLTSGRSHTAGMKLGSGDWVLTVNTTGTPVEAIRVNGTTGEVTFGSGGVGQSALKTTTGEVSILVTAQGTAEQTKVLPGGQYGFFPEFKYNQQGGNFGNAGAWDLKGSYTSSGGNTAFAATVQLTATSGDGEDITVTARQRYVQSSPPYDLGDGEVQGFVYLLLNANGTATGLYVAEDPPWYGNTRQAPRKLFLKGGKPFGRFVRPAVSITELKAGRVTLEEFKARCGECVTVDEEITSATKLRGMDELPHPFFPKPGQTAVLLDPMDDLTGRLVAMMQAGESVAELFAEDYLRVDNEALKRGGPPGVAVHAARWRSTG